MAPIATTREVMTMAMRSRILLRRLTSGASSLPLVTSGLGSLERLAQAADLGLREAAALASLASPALPFARASGAGPVGRVARTGRVARVARAAHSAVPTAPAVGLRLDAPGTIAAAASSSMQDSISSATISTSGRASKSAVMPKFSCPL